MLKAGERHAFLILSQVYVPDPASVGQHMADAAAELARRGHWVTVLTADRGYDNPSIRYARREHRDGVDIIRLPFSSFGKRSIPIRLFGGLSFVLQAIILGIRTPGLGAIVVSTSPPMAALAALVVSLVRRVPIKYWVMDINPDQALALGLARDGSLAVRMLDALNRWVLRRAADVIVLDRFMAARVSRKADVVEKLSIIPPWPLDDDFAPVAHEVNPFRRRHGLEGKRVIMYSGNHSPANPIKTMLDAAARLSDIPELVFLFVGGGLGKAEVEARAGGNIRSLPYQPLEALRYSLAAADVHLVSLGDEMVGIIHPSKVYSAMAVGRPILALGPAESHLGELVDAGVGWRVSHGDVDDAERLLRTIAAEPVTDLEACGRRAREIVLERFSRASLRGRLCDVLERGAPRPA